MATFTEQINARIARLDAEIARIADNASAEVARIRAQKATLLRAKSALTPENEKLVGDLKDLGVL